MGTFTQTLQIHPRISGSVQSNHVADELNVGLAEDVADFDVWVVKVAV